MEQDATRPAQGIEDDPRHDLSQSATDPTQTAESNRVDDDMESIAEAQEGDIGHP
jgi:hypothetical protein